MIEYQIGGLCGQEVFSASPLHASCVLDAKIRYPLSLLQLPYDIDFFPKLFYQRRRRFPFLFFYGSTPSIGSKKRRDSGHLRWHIVARRPQTSQAPKAFNPKYRCSSAKMVLSKEFQQLVLTGTLE